VDVNQITEKASKSLNVIVARHYPYMCADPGQDLIRDDIRELGLNRIVVASCSPLMHENTFRQACKDAGLNPYLFQMTNLREHVAWVAKNKHHATWKAWMLVNGAIKRVSHHEHLIQRRKGVRQSALVVGAGIAGMEAALRLADSGKHVYLVEREPGIGGHMAQLYKTFPTLDCAA
jgi:heterodisulfide reductase subunit A